MSIRTHKAVAALVLLGAGFFLLGPSSAGARESGDATSFVLVVAHNASLDPGVKPLRFADDDGARYFELFSQVTPHVSLLAVLDPDTARIHPQAARAARVPWLRELRREVGRIASLVERENRAGLATRFTFVYVGHGNVAPDGEGYVNLQDLRLGRQELFREVVDRVPASTIHLVIDACKSFFLVTRGPGDWRDDRSGRTYGAEVRAFLSQATLEARPHVGAILSTSGDEEVHEWSAFRSGVFSHQLRSALAGAADINADGKVEYSEVGAFIAAANQRVLHLRARLRPFVRPPAADLHAALFDLSATRDTALLELGPRERGRFTVEDDRGVRTLDLHKSAGRPLRVALAARHRFYVRHGDVESTLPRGTRGPVALDELEQGPVARGARGALDQTYRDGMFAVALSRSFYDGYLASADVPSVRFDAAAPLAATRRGALGLDLELSYLLSPPVLEIYDGVQHTLAPGLRLGLLGPLYVSVRAELGVSRHDSGPAGAVSLIRLGFLGGAGLAYRVRPPLVVALEANAGYQALLTSVEGQADPSGAKFGTQVLISFRPWRSLPRLALLGRLGLYGHVVTVVDAGRTGSTRERVFALPEGGVGASWGF